MSQDNWARAGTIAGGVGASAAVASLIVQLATLRKQASRVSTISPAYHELEAKCAQNGEPSLERRVRNLEKMIMDTPPKGNRVRRMQRTIDRSDDLEETVQILENELGP